MIMLWALFFKHLKTWSPLHQKDTQFCYDLIHINTYTNILWKKQVKKTWLPFLYGRHSDVSVLISLAWSILSFKHSGYDLARDVSILQWVGMPILRNPVASAASLWLRYLLVDVDEDSHIPRGPADKQLFVGGSHAWLVASVSNWRREFLAVLENWKKCAVRLNSGSPKSRIQLPD